jgi:hypothetical protein
MIVCGNVLVWGCWLSCLCFFISAGDLASTMSQLTEEQTRQLVDNLLELERTLGEKDKALDAKLAEGAYGDTQSSGHLSTPKTVYISREKKLVKFGGRPIKSSDLTAEEWIEEARDHLHGIEEEAARVEYLLDNLTGTAKDEVKVRASYQRNTAAKILEIIKECFEGEETSGQLHQRFYQREQREGETLQEYSLVLMKLMEQMTKKDMRVLGDKELMLMERFVDGVRDTHLQREMRKYAQENGGMPFVDFRRSVLSWMVGGVKGTGVPTVDVKLEVVRTNEAQALGSEQGMSQEVGDKSMGSMLQMLQAQQRMLEQQQRDLNSLMGEHRVMGQGGSRGQPSVNGGYRGHVGGGKRNLTCFRCAGRGHVVSECPSEINGDEEPKGSQRVTSGVGQARGGLHTGRGRGEYERLEHYGHAGHGSSGCHGDNSSGYTGYSSRGASGYGSRGFSAIGSRGRGYGSRGRGGYGASGYSGYDSRGHVGYGSSEQSRYGSFGHGEHEQQGNLSGERPGVGVNAQRPLNWQPPAI